MKTEKLLHEIGQIDDNIIAEADTIKFKSTKRVWFQWTAAAAACIAVVVGVIAFSNRTVQPIDREYPNLPMLTVNNETDGIFGFEGYLAYNIDELKNGNPWTESAEIDTLPVFQNTVTYDRAGRPVSGGLSADEMIEKARDTAAALGLTVDSVYTNPTAEDLQAWRDKERSIPGNEDFEPDTTPYEAVAVCGDIRIKVDPSGEVAVFFEPGLALPREYAFPILEDYSVGETITGDPVTGETNIIREENTPGEITRPDYDKEMSCASNTLSYLLDSYAALVNMQNPTPDISGDYNIYGQLHINYGAYEGHGDLTEQILGYWFNRITFGGHSEDGTLLVIRRGNMDLSQKLGDYPIITAKEARELLTQGHYISNVIYTADTEQFPGEKYISSVELVYRTGNRDEVFMPYYRFLVELPSMERDNGLKDYGAFYVPAVDGRYLENMMDWAQKNRETLAP